MKTNDIAQRIKQIRDICRLSVPQLSAIIKIDPSTIRRWESGETMPKADSLANFIEYLGINANWLVTGEGSMKNISDKELPADLLWLVSNYTSFSEETLTHLKNTILLYQKL